MKKITLILFNIFSFNVAAATLDCRIEQIESNNGLYKINKVLLEKEIKLSGKTQLAFIIIDKKETSIYNSDEELLEFYERKDLAKKEIYYLNNNHPDAMFLNQATLTTDSFDLENGFKLNLSVTLEKAKPFDYIAVSKGHSIICE